MKSRAHASCDPGGWPSVWEECGWQRLSIAGPLQKFVTIVDIDTHCQRLATFGKLLAIFGRSFFGQAFLVFWEFSFKRWQPLAAGLLISGAEVATVEAADDDALWVRAFRSPLRLPAPDGFCWRLRLQSCAKECIV